MDEQRKQLLMSALNLVLDEAGWKVEAAPPTQKKAQFAFVARFGDGPPVTFALADASKRSRKSGLVVIVHDDARPVEQRDGWVRLPAVAAAAGQEGVLHSRFGWDIVFQLEGRAQDLHEYGRQLHTQFVPTEERAPARLSPSNASIVYKSDGATCVDRLDLSGVAAHVLRNEKARKGGAHARNTLIAFRRCAPGVPCDQAAFFVTHFVAPHLARLESDQRIACLPLLLMGEEIRIEGLASSMRGAFWKAAQRSYSLQLYEQLTKLGYLHLYIVNGEQLRSDQDFDPNTRFITEVFAACEGDGRFTLGCARDYVFHDGAPDPVIGETFSEGRWEIGALRTLGQRFFLSEEFCVVDFGQRSASETDVLIDYAERTVAAAAKAISETSGGRCSADEARAALRALAKTQLAREGGACARADLRTVAEAILTDARRRPTHVAFVEAALGQSDLLLDLRAGRFVFRDKIARDFLMAETIASGLRYSLAARDHRVLLDALSSRVTEAVVFEMACRLARIEAVPNLQPGLAQIIKAFELTEKGPPPHMQIRAENAVRLLFSAADYLVQVSPKVWPDQRTFFGQIAGKDQALVMAGMALPQFTFRNLSMSRWTLENCNFRSAAFIDCDLTQLRAVDSYFGGAVIKDCSVGRFTKLERSNLSGCWIGGTTDTEDFFSPGGFEKRFEDANWTLGLVGGAGVSDARAALDFLADSGGVTTVLTVQSKQAAPEVGPSPPAFQAALLRDAWNDDVFIDESELSAPFIRRARTVLARRDGELAQPVRLAAFAFCTSDGRSKRGLLAIDGDKAAWTSIGGDGAAWRKTNSNVAIGEIEIFAAFDQDHASDRIWAAAIDEGNIAVLEISEGRSEVRSSYVARPNRGDPITVLRWAREASNVDPHFYIGFRSGAVERVARETESGAWKARTIRGADANAAVGAISLARRSQVLVVAHQNGLVTGVQSASTRATAPLFSFKTALSKVYDIVSLEGPGDQMILVGSTRGGGDPLCALFNASGDVQAVFQSKAPESEDAEELLLGEAAPARRAAAESETAALPDSTALQKRLAEHRLERTRSEVRPLSDRAEDKVVVIKLSSGAKEALESVIDTEDGPAFRHIVIDLVERDRDGANVSPVQDHFGEHEIEILKPQGGQIELRLPLVFAEQTELATLTLRISYKSGSQLLAEHAWAMDIDVLWRENPYESSGRAAQGATFFGRLRDIEYCASQLVRGNGIIVRAARRMGKSSFLASVARRISEQNHLAVVLSLAGSTKPKNEMASLIARGAEDALSPISAELAKKLREDLMNSGARGREALERFGDFAKRHGFIAPAVALIDEWGVISNSASALFDETFEQEIGETVQTSGASARTAICLASAPDDFVYRQTTAHQSDFYRGFDNRNAWVDLGPLGEDELRRLMSEPIEKRAGVITDERAAFALLLEMSGGDAYAANVIMARAYDMAVQRMNAEGGAQLRIETSDLDNELVLRDLASIYEVHMGYTFDQLTPENQRRFAQRCAEEPPPWEREAIEVPNRRDDPEQWGVFSRAGFRQSLDRGMRDARFSVWIPRGFAINVVERAKAGLRGAA